MNETLYKEFILDLYRHPLNKKVLDTFSVQQQEVNSSCGDDIVLQLQIDESGVVQDVGFQGQGCAISQAAISLLTDDIKGKHIDELQTFGETTMYELLQIPISITRKKCALLGVRALLGALNTYSEQQ